MEQEFRVRVYSPSGKGTSDGAAFAALVAVLAVLFAAVFVINLVVGAMGAVVSPSDPWAGAGRVATVLFLVGIVLLIVGNSAGRSFGGALLVIGIVGFISSGAIRNDQASTGSAPPTSETPVSAPEAAPSPANEVETPPPLEPAAEIPVQQRDATFCLNKIYTAKARFGRRWYAHLSDELMRVCRDTIDQQRRQEGR
jgi:hypothetical protein